MHQGFDIDPESPPRRLTARGILIVTAIAALALALAIMGAG